jgi:hypothetical protein
MVKRYELEDRQWDRIASVLPGKAGGSGPDGGGQPVVRERGFVGSAVRGALA